MDNKWEEYLAEIGIGIPFKKRIDEILNYYKETVGIEPKCIFVGDKSSDLSENKSFWIINENFICEAKNFASESVFDCIVLRNNIGYWEAKNNESDEESMDNGQEEFSITIKFKDSDGLSADMVASGANCDKLKEIFREYIVPNMAV